MEMNSFDELLSSETKVWQEQCDDMFSDWTRHFFYLPPVHRAKFTCSGFVVFDGIFWKSVTMSDSCPFVIRRSSKWMCNTSSKSWWSRSRRHLVTTTHCRWKCLRFGSDGKSMEKNVKMNRCFSRCWRELTLTRVKWLQIFLSTSVFPWNVLDDE